MARSYSVLIVDTDPQGLESLVQGFKGSDWNVTISPSLETIPLLLKASGANIVVLISRQDHAKAAALIEQLQATPGTERLSYLFLAPEAERNTLSPATNRGFLAMPAFVADIVCASDILVSAQLLTATNPNEEPTVEIPIPARGPISFVRTMCALGRSGSAIFEHGGKRGEFLFCEGGITSAQFGQWQGQAAAHHMLTWDSGLIRLHLRSVARRGHLGHTPEQFIEEADRFRRDFEHQLKVIGPRNTVYSKPEGKSKSAPSESPPDFLPILRLCDGHRTLNDVLNESPFRLMDTVRVIERLLNIGTLTRRAQPVEPRPTSATSDSFWETARIAGDSAEQVSPVQTIVAAPQPEPPAALPEVDQRSTIQPRRKDRRRTGNQTLTLGAPENITAQSSLEIPSSAASSGELAKSGARDPITATPETGARTSGTIEMGSTPDRRSRTNLPAVKDRPSIVIAIQDGPTKQSPGGPSPALVVPSPPTGTPTPLPAHPLPITLPPPAEPSASSSSHGAIPTTTSGEMPVARITGVLQVANSGRSSRITSTRQTVGTSIQLDASLSNGDHAATPSPAVMHSSVVAAVAEVANQPAKTATPSGGMRTSGTVQVSAPIVSKQSAHQPSGSIKIDASLSASAASKSGPHRAMTPIQGSAVAKPATGKVATHPHPTPAVSTTTDRKSHISGAFNAVESDFFAREADLYKDQEVETFHDLEEKNKNAPGKGRPHSKRPRR